MTINIRIQTESDDRSGSFWSDEWIYAMIASGFFSVLIITFLIIHSLWHFTHDRNKVTGTLRYLYLGVFLVNLITSLAYATLKVDLLIPLHDGGIPCSISYSSGVVGVAVSRWFTFTLFLFRIDMTFHGSALAYKRNKLYGLCIFYTIADVLIGGSMVWNAQPVIDYLTTTTGIGVCSIFEGTFATNITLAVFAFADTVMFFIVAYLFVRKLRQVCCLF